MKIKKLYIKFISIFKKKQDEEAPVVITDKFYNNIETMPAWNFLKTIQEKTFKYVAKQIDKYKPSDVKEGYEAWEELNRQYLNEFGITRRMRLIMGYEDQILIHKINIALGIGRNELNFMNRTKYLLEQLTKGSENFNYIELSSNVQKFMGFRLPLKEISVIEFFGHVETMSKQGNN